MNPRVHVSKIGRLRQAKLLITRAEFFCVTGGSDDVNLLPDDLHERHQFLSFGQYCKNLISVRKCFQIPSVPCLNNLVRLNFVKRFHTKSFFHGSRHGFVIFGNIYQNVYYFDVLTFALIKVNCIKILKRFKAEF